MRIVIVMILGAIATVSARISSSGMCADQGGGVTCQGSPFGDCCSQYGYCGSSSAYCGTGCQSDYGVCGDEDDDDDDDDDDSSSTDSDDDTPQISPDATCGGVNGYICIGSVFGSCCSQYGWCGESSAYCGTGCDSAFGTCSIRASSTPLQASSTSSSKSSSIPPSSSSTHSPTPMSSSTSTVSSTRTSSSASASSSAPSTLNCGVQGSASSANVQTYEYLTSSNYAACRAACLAYNAQGKNCQIYGIGQNQVCGMYLGTGFTFSQVVTPDKSYGAFFYDANCPVAADPFPQIVLSTKTSSTVSSTSVVTSTPSHTSTTITSSAASTTSMVTSTPSHTSSVQPCAGLLCASVG